MKLAVFLFVIIALESSGQVMFRNDITLGKHQKSRNKGFSFITINLGRRYGPDMYAPGRSGAMLIIDVDALRHPHKTYTYRQLAERVYNIDPILLPPTPRRVPEFLLIEPPVIKPRAVPTIRVRRSQSSL